MAATTTCLWFATEPAARRACAALPGSAPGRVVPRPAGMPGPAGGAMIVAFALAGATMRAVDADPPSGCTGAVAPIVSGDGQAAPGRVRDALVAGGEPQARGMPRDRFGVPRMTGVEGA